VDNIEIIEEEGETVADKKATVIKMGALHNKQKERQGIILALLCCFNIIRLKQVALGDHVQ
jgi:hypothetical protein